MRKTFKRNFSWSYFGSFLVTTFSDFSLFTPRSDTKDCARRIALNFKSLISPEKWVSEFIDKEYCTVRYSSIDDAVRMVQKLGKGARLAKADIKSAFRLLRIWPGDFDQLGFSFSGTFYFDKCLPMGVAVSCSLFEKFSSALHWYTEFCSQDKNIIHYLDDFLFGGEDNTTQCFDTLTTFQKVCKIWRGSH